MLCPALGSPVQDKHEYTGLAEATELGVGASYEENEAEEARSWVCSSW